jgi:hypothetical protein
MFNDYIIPLPPLFIVIIFYVGYFTSVFKTVEFVMNKIGPYKSLSTYKKRYVIKNLLKSNTLFLMTPGTLLILKDIFMYNKWNNASLHILGTIYSLTDFISLLLVPGLPMTTKLHHGFVTIFGIINIINDYTQPNIVRMLIIYGALSTISFSVNGYLGLRYITQNDKLLNTTALLSFCVYVICFTINWLYHYYYIITIESMTFATILYFIAAHIIMYDDIKLMGHLIKRVRHKNETSKCD